MTTEINVHGRGKVAVTFRIGEADLDRLKEIATCDDRSASSWIRRAVKRALLEESGTSRAGVFEVRS